MSIAESFGPLYGNSEMGRRVHAFDWSSTPLGPLSRWPVSLQITVAQMLASKIATCLFWGADLIAIHNDAYQTILGDKSAALGRPMRETWSEVWPQIEPLARKALAGESTFLEDYALRLERNGIAEDRFFTFSYGPMFDDQGAVSGMVDTVLETTSKVMAQQDAREERERQQNLLRQMPGFAAVLTGPEHVFDYVNDAYVTISGPRNFIGRSVREVFPDIEGQGFFELLDKVYATGESVSVSAIPISLDREGGERHIDLLYEPIRDRTGHVQGIFVGGYDVTSRVQAEAELRESETRLRALNADLERRVNERALAVGRSWHISPDLLCVMNTRGQFTAVNPAFEKIFGWTEAELTGAPFANFVNPDDLAATYDAWSDMVERGLPALRFENRWRTKSGGLRWISWVGVPEGDDMYCIGRDITDQKENARILADAMEALRQSQKMEAVGQLTGGIAHDFNNLLAAISGSLQVVKLKLARGQTEGLERYVDIGEKSIHRAASLTQRLLAFSRRQTLDPKPVNVNRMVIGMDDLIRRTVGPGVNLEVVGAGGLWTTRVDPSQLENVLLNLCINARDAMLPNGGRLTIETANKWLDDRTAAERELPPGQYISLCVSDTGTGIAPEIVKRIFDPFFTTKPTGQGTGLGLSMVYGFARQSGGHIRVYTEVGHGTTMCLYLPRHLGEATEEDAAEPPSVSAAGDGETVVVVEDEDSIRLIIVEVLEEAGYRVLQAADGPAGLRLLQSGTAVDLLVSDVGLPGGLNGRQIADAGRILLPELKVLFLTGYAENAAVGNGLMETGMQVMTKPFNLEELTTKVREMLEARS